MKPTIQLCETATAPVHWLRDEAALRAYLAQRDHCLRLYIRARSQGFYGQAGGTEQTAAPERKGTSRPRAATGS